MPATILVAAILVAAILVAAILVAGIPALSDLSAVKTPDNPFSSSTKRFFFISYTRAFRFAFSPPDTPESVKKSPEREKVKRSDKSLVHKTTGFSAKKGAPSASVAGDFRLDSERPIGKNITDEDAASYHAKPPGEDVRFAYKCSPRSPALYSELEGEHKAGGRFSSQCGTGYEFLKSFHAW